jgi:hypothetical protein
MELRAFTALWQLLSRIIGLFSLANMWVPWRAAIASASSADWRRGMRPEAERIISPCVVPHNRAPMAVVSSGDEGVLIFR